jgi:hypothetical protein
VIVVTRADAANVELSGDLRAFGVSLVIIPAQSFIAAIGIDDVYQSKARP